MLETYSPRLMERADIRELARARRLVTRELYPFNAFYGHAELLRTYAGVTGSDPLKAAIEHGLTFFPNLVDPDLATHLPYYFCAASRQARFFEEHALYGARAVAIGAPILYARALAPPQQSAAGRRLVFFDAHSSDYATAKYDVDATAVRLRELSGEFDDVVICLYWRDVVLGRDDLYRAQGFRCVTAGHMFDAQFLFRLLEIVSSAAIVLTDQLGSHVPYALVLDRPVWFEDSRVEYELAHNAPRGTLGPPKEGEMLDRAAALLSRRVERVEPEQRAFAEELCGIENFRTPAEVAELLAEAEAAYRSATPVWWRLRLEATAAARRRWNAMHW
jgi:hypothetical protein